MAAPTNTTALTAVAIPSLPYSVTQTVDDAGTTYTVWYSYTAVAGDVEIGIFGFGDLVVYQPTTVTFLGPAAAPVQYLGGLFALNRPVQIPVTPGTTYYFRFSPNAGNPTPSVLTLAVERGAQLALQAGLIFVNDDTDGFPGVLIDPNTSAAHRFIYPFVPGEAGDILPDGTLLYADAWNGVLKLYDTAFTEMLTITDDIGFSVALRAQQALNRFYAGKDQSPAVVTVYDSAGALLSTHTLTGHAGISGIAANNAGTILYHTRGDLADPINRWDLVADADLTNLVAGVAAHRVWDLLVLADDTIIASYLNASGTSVFARHYSAAGSLLLSYAATTSDYPAGTLPRLAYGLDSSSFWMWHHPDDAIGMSRFREIRVSDGSILTSIDVVEYEGGVYQLAATATPLERFGHSFSCPFVILREALPSACPAPNPAAVAGVVCIAAVLGGGS